MAARAGRGNSEGQTIVIKRVTVAAGGHHGGAWKVAYADFVTAMMAFFLLMWLLNATTQEQRRGLADYFAPTNVLGRTTTGSGLPFGGKTVNSDGTMASDAGAIRIERGPLPVLLDIEEEEAEPTPANRPPPPQPAGEQSASPTPARWRRSGRRRPSGRNPKARRRPARPCIRRPRPNSRPRRRRRCGRGRNGGNARPSKRRSGSCGRRCRTTPRWPNSRASWFEQVPEGLRIQLLDADRLPMFALGGAAPNDRARALLQKVAQVVGRLPNRIAVAGHTDATPFRGPGSNWDLSADRANAVRRLLAEAGVAEGRIRSVSGLAERELLLPDDPTAAANRRVALTLLRNTALPETGGR